MQLPSPLAYRFTPAITTPPSPVTCRYAVRDCFALIDFEQESSASLRDQLLRAALTGQFVTHQRGKKLLSMYVP